VQGYTYRNNVPGRVDPQAAAREERVWLYRQRLEQLVARSGLKLLENGVRALDMDGACLDDPERNARWRSFLEIIRDHLSSPDVRGARAAELLDVVNATRRGSEQLDRHAFRALLDQLAWKGHLVNLPGGLIVLPMRGTTASAAASASGAA
jgi:hypothetical protein